MTLGFTHFGQGDVMLLAVGENVVIGGREGEERDDEEADPRRRHARDARALDEALEVIMGDNDRGVACGESVRS